MKYYCIGIKGSGMATLAEILYDLGNEVSGYDDYKDYKFTQEGIDKRGIKIYYDTNHELDSDTIVTYSKAFSMEHPEIKRIHELGLKVIEYNELLGKLSSVTNLETREINLLYAIILPKFSLFVLCFPSSTTLWESNIASIITGFSSL